MSLRRKFDLCLLAACGAALGGLLLRPPRPPMPAFYHPTFIAHRGYSDRYPENTIASILEAARHGAPWIEVDVRRTADGRLVLHHDAAARDVGFAGTIAQAPLSRLEARPIAGSDERIPTLDETVRAMAGTGAKLYLHLKDSPLDPAEAGQIVAVCRARGFLDRVRFNSGSLRTLSLLRALAPQAWLEYDLYDAEGPWLPHHLNAAQLVTLHDLAVKSVGTFGFKINEALVRQVHRNGLTIDALVSAGGGPFLSERATFEDMKALGVDEIMTDHIARYLIK